MSEDVAMKIVNKKLTMIHNMVPADGTVVDYDIPRPQSNGVPLSALKV
jgi:hypothetical protein